MGRTVTMKLITSNPTEVSATATAQAWTIIKCEGLTLDGTYVDLQFTIDGADTFYVVPLGVNIGEKAAPLSPRGLRYVASLSPTNVVNGADPGASWTDVDVTAITGALACAAVLNCTHLVNATGKLLSIRLNGQANSLTIISQSVSTSYAMSGNGIVALDDGQVFEYVGSDVAANTEQIWISVSGWWEWA